MRTRRLFHKLHLWPSLFIGLLFVTTTLTGSILVFKDEIDKTLNPALFHATSGDVGYERAYAVAHATFPYRRIISIASPVRGNGVYQVTLDDDPATSVYVNPGTGTILGSRHAEESLTGRVRALHTSLFAGDIGKYVVALGGICLLFVLGTGCYLWWPRWAGLKLAFTVRRNKGVFIFNFDLHKVIGIVSAPLLTVIVVSGILLIFSSFANSAIHALFLSAPSHEPPIDLIKSRPAQSARLSLDEYARLAEESIPGVAVMTIMTPINERDPVMVTLKSQDDPRPAGSGRIWLDQYNGAVLARVNPRKLSSADNLYRSWRSGLHSGAYGGAVVRALYVFLGCVPFVMMATGFAIWRRRRRSLAVAGVRRQKIKADTT